MINAIPWIITIVGLGVQVAALVFTLRLRLAIAELKIEIVQNRWTDAETLKHYVDDRLTARGHR